MRHCSSGHTEDCAGTSSEVIGCQKPPCGAWSAWFNGQCSVTCGNGTLTRMRHCSTGHSEDCVGNSREVIDCKKTPCKVDGVWSSWSLWAQCDVTCEDGHIYRTRMCSNPPPAFGGLNCSGASQEANTCRLARCPDWSPWFNGKCSVTCGNGTETRVRNCSTGYKEDCAGKAAKWWAVKWHHVKSMVPGRRGQHGRNVTSHVKTVTYNEQGRVPIQLPPSGA
ncbi:thrombospondin-2-like isoform X1 [Dreissena polymorpha]|uniref:thrombospondin-2-like isoform X1 n=1 Tax=Dreissena polymorpha TaxID=45954 RepID=UPI00226492E1|nr:thrombospondin-2-like isoform X1 [Dreissena polymorpha]XP_052278853.1 thrombospondin-2-like isoform X1 [Dreissena polymorpha]